MSKSMFENVKFTLLMMDTKYRQADYSYLQFCIFFFKTLIQIQLKFRNWTPSDIKDVHGLVSWVDTHITQAKTRVQGEI